LKLDFETGYEEFYLLTNRTLHYITLITLKLFTVMIDLQVSQHFNVQYGDSSTEKYPDIIVEMSEISCSFLSKCCQ